MFAQKVKVITEKEYVVILEREPSVSEALSDLKHKTFENMLKMPSLSLCGGTALPSGGVRAGVELLECTPTDVENDYLRMVRDKG